MLSDINLNMYHILEEIGLEVPEHFREPYVMSNSEVNPSGIPGQSLNNGFWLPTLTGYFIVQSCYIINCLSEHLDVAEGQ